MSASKPNLFMLPNNGMAGYGTKRVRQSSTAGRLDAMARPTDLVHGRLLLEARRLLAYTPMTVAQIATTLGYDDPAYFGKFFSRSVGEPPSSYRDAVNSGLRIRESQPASG